MIQQQIQQFTNSLQNIAMEYSDPAIIVQHIPVLRDYPLLQQNPEYLMYGLGGIFALLFIKRRMSKRRKAREKNIALVMPQPYVGIADAAHTDETAPKSYAKDAPAPQDDDFDPRLAALSERSAADRIAPAPTARAPEQVMDDIAAITFSTKPAFTPDEARMRVIVQSVINEYGAGYMIMARASLAALLEPGRETVGPDRAHAIAAIADKYIDFGIFDRAGRLVLALDVTSSAPAVGAKAQNRDIVRAALAQAGLNAVKLTFGETPADVRSKIAPYLKATAQAAAGPKAIRPASDLSAAPARLPRPARPARPARFAAMAAE